MNKLNISRGSIYNTLELQSVIWNYLMLKLSIGTLENKANANTLKKLIKILMLR